MEQICSQPPERVFSLGRATKPGQDAHLFRKGVCWGGGSGSKANNTQDSLGPKGKSSKVRTEDIPCLLNPGLAPVPSLDL